MIHSLRWQDIVDILVVSFIIYRVFLLIKGTRAIQLIIGFIIVFLVFYLSRRLELFTMGWILNNFVGSIILVIVIIFQNDIRRMLLALGKSPFFKQISYVDQTFFYDELANACMIMANRKTGCLIVIEREVGLEEYMEIGVRLDAEVNTELIVSLFQHDAPLHDGALIIREGRIRAASCILPITLKEDIAKNLGTRHRAAIGITEVSDAVSVVVSEERGKISYSYKGEIFSDVSVDSLKKILTELLG